MITANMHFGTSLEKYEREALLPKIRQLQKSFAQRIDTSPHKALIPRTNQGRWIVDCPFCNGAEFAWEENLFICESCWNKAVGYQYIIVKLPTKRKRESIENLLANRPLTNQNWEGETLEQLKQENLEHGVK